jgi:GNAT superfamily N-acetyltransferase
LAAHRNYPGWKKGVYPTIDHAIADVAESRDYIAWADGSIIGSIVLNHEPEQPPASGQWLVDADDGEVLTVHRLAVHPKYQRQGVGRVLLDFVDGCAREKGIRAIRLDVYEGNTAAIRMYEQCGYRYIDTVDLGLGCYGLDRFRLYEKPVAGN